MKAIILANAEYCVRTLTSDDPNSSLPDAEVRGAARALEAVMGFPEGWPLTLALVSALHPQMERRGYWNEWELMLTHLLARAKSYSDPAAELTLGLRLGRVQLQRGALEPALVSFRRAARVGRQLGRFQDQATALSNLGEIYRQLQNFHRAEKLCRRAIEQFKAVEDRVGLAYTLNNLALIYSAQGRGAETLGCLEQARNLFEQCGNSNGLAYILHNLGIFYTRADDFDQAQDCFNQAITCYQLLGDTVSLALIQLNLGYLYLKNRAFSQAEAVSLQAEVTFRQIGDGLNLARTRHNLGMIYTRVRNPEEAERCFLRAIEQWRARQDDRELANTLGELAEFYLQAGRRFPARLCLDEAWKLVQNQDPRVYGSLQAELAERRHRLQGI